MTHNKTIHHEGREEHDGSCGLSPFGDNPANPEPSNRMMPDARLQGHPYLSKPGVVLLRGLLALRGANEVFA